jgi:hypothetical protein
VSSISGDLGVASAELDEILVYDATWDGSRQKPKLGMQDQYRLTTEIIDLT